MFFFVLVVCFLIIFILLSTTLSCKEWFSDKTLDFNYRLFHYSNGRFPKTTILRISNAHYVCDWNNDWTKFKGYSLDMDRYLHLLSKKKFEFRWHPFDRVEWFEEPVLVKSRSIKPDRFIPKVGSILLKLNTINHFEKLQEVGLLDIPWENKKSVVVWRGNPTGYGFGNHIPFRSSSRWTLVQMYVNHPSDEIDIGLATVQHKRPELEQYYKDWKTLDQLLRYKYIISIEGNDVATNLKWILGSQSIVLMPPPKIESWIMEGHLIPYFHYVPLREDLSDVLEKKRWCDKNPKICETIRRHANRYIRQFMDVEKENRLHKKILESYLDNISISTPPEKN